MVRGDNKTFCVEPYKSELPRCCERLKHCAKLSAHGLEAKKFECAKKCTTTKYKSMSRPSKGVKFQTPGLFIFLVVKGLQLQTLGEFRWTSWVLQHWNFSGRYFEQIYLRFFSWIISSVESRPKADINGLDCALGYTSWRVVLNHDVAFKWVNRHMSVFWTYLFVTHMMKFSCLQQQLESNDKAVA